MSGFMRNPVPMGTQAALGAATQATQLMASKAYGSMGGRKSASRRKPRATKRTRTAAKRSTGRKLKFGSPAWRAKYMKRSKRK